MQPARIKTNLFAIPALDRQPIVFLVHAFHTRVFSGFDAVCFAASCVPHHVVNLVPPGPLAVRAGNFFALPAFEAGPMMTRRFRRPPNFG